jgi:hypothetical protein
MFNEFNQSWAEIKTARSVQGLYTNDKGAVTGADSKLYVGGMCHTMSLYWVAHQSGGRPGRFVDWVVSSGDRTARKGPTINKEAVGVMIAKTVMYKAKGDAAVRQGIVNQSGSEFDNEFFARYKVRPANEESKGFANIKTLLSRKKDRFYMLSYSSATGGHACAAQSTNKGWIYFDCNYGEALMFDRTSFAQWWDDYIAISGYGAKYTSQTATAYKS